MNKGLFATQLNEGEMVLKTAKLFQARELFPRYPERAAALFRGLSYYETWLKCYTNQYYDFVLNDFSLIQFRAEKSLSGSQSYSYLECPYKTISYEVFVTNSLNLNIEDVGDELRREYELEISSFPRKETVTPIRYDFDPGRYEEGSHPASHVHFGHSNHIRIGTAKKLNPISFILFVIRQHYKSEWKSLCKLRALNHEKEKIRSWSRNVRENLDGVEEHFWGELDKWEMHLM